MRCGLQQFFAPGDDCFRALSNSKAAASLTALTVGSQTADVSTACWASFSGLTAVGLESPRAGTATLQGILSLPNLTALNVLRCSLAADEVLKEILSHKYRLKLVDLILPEPLYEIRDEAERKSIVERTLQLFRDNQDFAYKLSFCHMGPNSLPAFTELFMKLRRPDGTSPSIPDDVVFRVVAPTLIPKEKLLLGFTQQDADLFASHFPSLRTFQTRTPGIFSASYLSAFSAVTTIDIRVAKLELISEWPQKLRMLLLEIGQQALFRSDQLGASLCQCKDLKRVHVLGLADALSRAMIVQLLDSLRNAKTLYFSLLDDIDDDETELIVTHPSLRKLPAFPGFETLPGLLPNCKHMNTVARKNYDSSKHCPGLMKISGFAQEDMLPAHQLKKLKFLRQLRIGHLPGYSSAPFSEDLIEMTSVREVEVYSSHIPTSPFWKRFLQKNPFITRLKLAYADESREDYSEDDVSDPDAAVANRTPPNPPPVDQECLLDLDWLQESGPSLLLDLDIPGFAAPAAPLLIKPIRLSGEWLPFLGRIYLFLTAGVDTPEISVQSLPNLRNLDLGVLSPNDAATTPTSKVSNIFVKNCPLLVSLHLSNFTLNRLELASLPALTHVDIRCIQWTSTTMDQFKTAIHLSGLAPTCSRNIEGPAAKGNPLPLQAQFAAFLEDSWTKPSEKL